MRARRRQGLALVRGAPACVAFHVRLAQGQRQQRVPQQVIVVVQVLIAQRKTIQPLCKQLLRAVFYEVFVPMVGKAPRQTPRDSKPRIHLAQQQRATVRRQMPSIKRRDNRPPPTPLIYPQF